MAPTITLPQGIDAAIGWTLTGPDGTPADPAGLTLTCQVRALESPTSRLLADLTTSIDTLPDGTVLATASWTAEQSLTWGWVRGHLDAVLTLDGRPIQVLDQTPVYVDRIVTHA